jgi:hypothetical protein
VSDHPESVEPDIAPETEDVPESGQPVFPGDVAVWSTEGEKTKLVYVAGEGFVHRGGG